MMAKQFPYFIINLSIVLCLCFYIQFADQMPDQYENRYELLDPISKHELNYQTGKRAILLTRYGKRGSRRYFLNNDDSKRAIVLTRFG
uniref:Neuropeptide 3 n=1 Tax=Schmidtea mediterranea TaxID=79327 RepID=E3T7U9_SCHMD|nr:neuropeptide precursor 3 [Schmidtea mediterranea]